MIDYKTFETRFQLIELNFNFKYPAQLIMILYEKIKNIEPKDFEEGIKDFLSLKSEEFNKHFKFGGIPPLENCAEILLKPSKQNTKQIKVTPYLMQNEVHEKEVIPQYRIIMAEQFENFKNTTAGDYAASNRCLGYYYKNGKFAEMGLVHYLGQIMLKQVQIITKYQDCNFSFGTSPIKAFNHEQQQNYQNWLDSEEFENYFRDNPKININYNRKNDMIIIAKYYRNKL